MTIVSTIFPSHSGGKSEHIFRKDDAERKRAKSGRNGSKQYPMEGKFSVKEAWEYMHSDPMVCLLCGRGLQKLGQHLSLVHDVSSRDYCVRFGLPERSAEGKGLATLRQRERSSKSALGSEAVQAHLATDPWKKAQPAAAAAVAAKIRAHGNLLTEFYRQQTLQPKACITCGVVFRPDNRKSVACSLKCRPHKERQVYRCCECGMRIARQAWKEEPRCADCYHKYRKEHPSRISKEEALERARLRDRERYKRRMEDPVWVEKERLRSRERKRAKSMQKEP